MFSPSPFPQNQPRRGGRRTASQALAPAPRRPAGGSRAPSRLTTPLRADSERPSAGDVSARSDGASEMDVDADAGPRAQREREGRARGAVLFAQSPELSVALHAPLPAEVLQALRSADFAREAFTGGVDGLTQFCVVASAQTCYTWRYAQTLLGAPTCFIFPCPPAYPHAAPPFAGLPCYGAAREPGLVLLSPGGEVRFWDSVGMGLTGGEHWDLSHLELHDDETVTTLARAQPLEFIASTTAGRLFILTITSTSGRFHVKHHCFSLSRPQSAISRLKFWGTSAPVYSGGSINAVAVGASIHEGYELWTCIETSVARWSVMNEGWEQLDFEQDISEFITPSLLETFPSTETDNGVLDLELVDLCVDAEDSLVVLTSFAGHDDESGMDNRPRRFYAIVRLTRLVDAFNVEAVRTVPYQTISADRAVIHPQLRLLNRGAMYSVQFGDAVTLVAKDSEYNTCLTLKSLQDRTFGCGVVEDSHELLLMNSMTLMKVEFDQAKIDTFDPETGRATLIKSIMTQAILYAANPENPLLFSFPPDVDEESLISGAEQLSRAVLASDNEVVRPNHDLTRQLGERKDRLRFLIGFINENGALGMMSQSSRQRLLSDAEKLYAAQQLWVQYCERVAAGFSQELFAAAVQTYMEDNGEGYHEDILRAFFRLQTCDICSLLPYILQLTQETLTSWDLSQRLPDALPGANHVVLTVLESAWDYRTANAGVYGIVQPFLRPWTSEPPVIDIVMNLFDATTEHLAQASTDDLRQTAFLEFDAQLPRLATAAFVSFQERLNWLGSPAAADEFGTETEERDLHDRFQQIRLPVLQTLFKHKHEKAAFHLAEEYRDFRSLTELCHATPPIYPPQDNPNALRIQSYIEQFKDEFTSELYQWYIEHAELRVMFSQSDIYGSYLDSFFSKHPQPSISWIHDLDKGRWGTAALTLLSQANQNPHLATRHVMLSIGKLSQLAHLNENDAIVEEPPLDAFHDGLDYISVHQKLIEELKLPLASGRPRQTLESQVNAIAKAEATTLANRPAFLAFFKQCVKNLLQGRVLSVEDLVDVLTLKDKPADYSTALQLIKSMKDVPEARRISAYKTAWRRIFIHDDWATITKTANVTDARIIARFKHTSLYAVVADVLSSSGDFDADVLPPREAESLPTEEELMSRWPGHFAEQIADIKRDYETELRTLRSLELDYVFDRVKELALLNAP